MTPIGAHGFLLLVGETFKALGSCRGLFLSLPCAPARTAYSQIASHGLAF